MFSLLSFRLGVAQGMSLSSLFDWHYYFRGLRRGVRAFWHIHMSLPSEGKEQVNMLIVLV